MAKEKKRRRTSPYKAKYEKLKRSRGGGIVGKFTGAINNFARSMRSLGPNIVSGVAASLPIIQHGIPMVRNAIGGHWKDAATEAGRMIEQISGYDPVNPSGFDIWKPISYGAGVVLPQLVKKGANMRW